MMRASWIVLALALTGAVRALPIPEDGQEDAGSRRSAIRTYLDRGDFEAAHDLAIEANRAVPDDLATYGLLAEAALGLGLHDEAEVAVQWMLDLRPDDGDAQLHAARLRGVLGDVDGALDLYAGAIQRADPTDPSLRAGFLAEAAELQVSSGRIEAALLTSELALSLDPHLTRALAARGRSLLAGGRVDEAIEALAAVVGVERRPVNAPLLASAFERAGRPSDAARTWAAFESWAQEHVNATDNLDPPYIGRLADTGRADEALRLARRDAARRSDVATLGALAWALHAAGDGAAAHVAMNRALAVGTRDATLLYHGGVIAASTGDLVAARSRLRDALAIDPSSPAASFLATLEVTPALPPAAISATSPNARIERTTP